MSANKLAKIPGFEAFAQKAKTGAVKSGYVPKPPEISFQQGMRMSKRPRRIVAQKKPFEATFEPEKLESNFFARLLAARPKMDLTTHLVFPSTLFTKLGFEDGKLTAISPSFRGYGPRCYVSANTTDLNYGIKGELIKDRVEFKDLPVTDEFAKDLLDVTTEDLRTLLEKYRPSGSPILALNADVEGVPRIDFTFEGFDLPETISPGPDGSGVRLAGMLYKLWYIQHANNSSLSP